MHPFLLTLLPVVLASVPQVPLSQNQYGPNRASAAQNANLIFNSIHSSMRQWGSSVQHNGMSFYPAYVPEGTLLYHGDGHAKRVEGVEWLAFEIQHAEMFASRVKFRNSTTSASEKESNVLNPDEEDLEILDLRNDITREQTVPPVIEFRPGYLHIYQATRQLKLLYLEGMSAAKCDLGTMDTQDVVLLNFTLHKWADRERAKQLCALGDVLGVEGFIRMEAGFEIIKCNFSEGLDFISHKRRPERDEPEGFNSLFLLDYIREVSGRYGGIDAGRVKLDYSKMVSAYWYPTNLSNPDQDPGQSMLPRLVGSDKTVLERIKSDLVDSLKDAKSTRGVDWQGIADMIVKRYSARLQFMASDPPQKLFLSQINNLLNIFVDYGTSKPQDPIETCSLHYLPVQLLTEQDRLIEAAFKTVTHKVCTALFEVRELLFKNERDGDLKELENSTSAVELIRDLMKWLDFSDWKLCGQCAVNEVCFIAVFPFGTAEDHYNPRCANSTSISQRMGDINTNYWIPKNIYPQDWRVRW